MLKWWSILKRDDYELVSSSESAETNPTSGVSARQKDEEFIFEDDDDDC